MKIYHVKARKLSGTTYADVHKKSLVLYRRIRKKTKRRPYVRSAYFKKDKIFLDAFWLHLYEKLNLRDKTRRLKYFSCAIELIEKSRIEPVSKENPNKRSEILHRFAGVTKENDLFFVQIKEYKHTGKKLFMSVFPEGK
jgi:hypothetical protein